MTRLRLVLFVLLAILLLLAVLAPVSYTRARYNNCAHDPIGDVNGDGQVNIQDYSVLSKSWGKRIGQPGFNANADLDCDGHVGEWDYRIFELGLNLWWQHDDIEAAGNGIRALSNDWR